MGARKQQGCRKDKPRVFVKWEGGRGAANPAFCLRWRRRRREEAPIKRRAAAVTLQRAERRDTGAN